jgi:hypothetical protein
MKTTSQLTASLADVFEHPSDGVVGLVDDLLRLCPEHGLHLDWQAGRCRVRSLGENGSQEVLDRPFRKSVFRAVLARIAALCNERSPGSVSPYGGQGKLVLESEPSTIFRITFVNTSDEQELTLVPATI